MQRDTFVDTVKGYACFLVVFGHVIMGMRLAGVAAPAFFPVLERFIWSFHVALFLFLSGYVYQMTGGWKSKGTRLRFIRHKCINLGVPYVIFSVLYIVINSVVGGANTQFSPADVFSIWKTPVAQYWFLYALFFLFCIWTVLSGVLQNLQITFFVVLLGYVLPLFGLGFGAFDVVIYSALPFGLGTFLNMQRLKKGSVPLRLFIIGVHLVLGLTLSFFALLDAPGIKEGMLVLGIYASILFISLLKAYRLPSRFFLWINRYSFQIYLLHTIFTAGIRMVLIRLHITFWPIHLVCGCVFGIGLSVLAAKIAEKVPFFNLCFFPSKAYKELHNQYRG